MKELDALLTAYLDDQYEQDGDADKAAFRALLMLPDPDLVSYLLQRKTPDSEPEARVVERILRGNSS